MTIIENSLALIDERNERLSRTARVQITTLDEFVAKKLLKHLSYYPKFERQEIIVNFLYENQIFCCNKSFALFVIMKALSVNS